MTQNETNPAPISKQTAEETNPVPASKQTAEETNPTPISKQSVEETNPAPASKQTAEETNAVEKNSLDSPSQSAQRKNAPSEKSFKRNGRSPLTRFVQNSQSASGGLKDSPAVKTSASETPAVESLSVETPSGEYCGDQTTHSLKTGELTVEGYSRAAVQTFWRIPELKLGFDLGWQPWEYMGTPRWFISHTHMDHLLALPAYAARRRMMKMPPPVVYLPIEKVGEARQLLGIFSRLDQGKLPCQFVGVADGDEIELSRELVVTVSKTFHTLPSVGYVVWERRKKLKPEFLDLPGEAIRDLKLGGTEITYEVRLPRVAYLGDSTAQGLDHNPDMFKADILITEMTFVAPDHRREAIKKFGHLHLDDFVDRLDRFENKIIIAAHFSTRYNDRQIMTQVRRRIPDMMDDRLKLWL